MDRNQIYDSVKDCLVEALGVDDSEVSPETSLTEDLEAESIDFVDIIFRMEKAFKVKIPQGELFPQDVFNNQALVKDGKFTSQGLDTLRGRYPFIDFSDVNGELPVADLAKYYTVDMLVSYMEQKLQEAAS